MNVETYNFPVYICGCGYRTGHSSNAARHKKVMCGCEMRTEKMEFVLKHEYTPYCEEIAESDYTTIETSVLNEEREQNKQTISQLTNTIQNHRNSLESMNGKVRRAFANMTKTAYNYEIVDDLTDMITDGIIYFITDKDVPDRGKIGRTMNTDVRKLKTRYSTFGKPEIMCYFSNDIIADENAIKKLMRAAGCMESNKEMISNVSMAREIFYEFIEMTR